MRHAGPSCALLVLALTAASFGQNGNSCAATGKRFFDQKKYKEAIFTLEKCADVEQSRQILGLSYFKLGYMEQAKEFLAKALEAKPDDPDLRLHYGHACALNKEFQKAIEIYSSLLKVRPDYVEAQKGLAQALGWNKEYKEAIALYQQLVLENPADYESWIQEGVLKSWSRRFDAAVKVFRSILSTSPPQPWDSKARFHLAEVLSWQKKFGLAQTEYLSLIGRDPRYVDGYLGLGELYEWQGQYKKAIAQYDRALQVDPVNKKAKARLTQLMWVD